MPKGVYQRPSAEVRFWAKVHKTDTCWLWTGGVSAYGYGKFAAVHGHTIMAHRWAYEQVNGPIPLLPNGERTPLDHFVCSKPACVNPSHLRPVTHRENVLRSEGLAAVNMAKTHCHRGHPFDSENTQYFGPGYRRCRECQRGYDRLYKRELRRRAALQVAS